MDQDDIAILLYDRSIAVNLAGFSRVPLFLRPEQDYSTDTTDTTTFPFFLPVST